MFKYLFIILLFTNVSFALAPSHFETDKIDNELEITLLSNNKAFIDACKNLTRAFNNISDGIDEPENFQHLLTPNNIDQSFSSWVRHLFLESIQFFDLFAEEQIDLLYQSPEEIATFSDDINDKLTSAYIDLKLIWNILYDTNRFEPFVGKFANPKGEKIEISRSMLMIYYATAILKISPNSQENASKLRNNIIEINNAFDLVYSFVKVKDNKYYLEEHEAEKAV